MTPAPKRRWLRFSLRTMFVVVTVACIWLGRQFSFVQQRKAALKAYHQRYDHVQGMARNTGFGGVSIRYEIAQEMNGHPPTIPRIRAWMGDHPVPCITVPLRSEAESLKPLFPESEIWYIDPKDIAWFELVGSRHGIHRPLDKPH